jgi:hypothetical protein
VARQPEDRCEGRGVRVSDHAATATDQLALADHLGDSWEQQHAHALASAQVHALLEVAAAIREAAALALVETALS